MYAAVTSAMICHERSPMGQERGIKMRHADELRRRRRRRKGGDAEGMMR